MSVFKINGKKEYMFEEDLKKLLLEHMEKKRHVRVHWRGCSESARLLKDGTVKALGRLDGREWHKHTIYKDFDNWFKESIIEETSLDITFNLEKDYE